MPPPPCRFYFFHDFLSFLPTAVVPLSPRALCRSSVPLSFDPPNTHPLPANIHEGDKGDAVIVCGSSVQQVKANVDACADETPLPKVGSIHIIISTSRFHSDRVGKRGVAPVVCVPGYSSSSLHTVVSCAAFAGGLHDKPPGTIPKARLLSAQRYNAICTRFAHKNMGTTYIVHTKRVVMPASNKSTTRDMQIRLCIIYLQQYSCIDTNDFNHDMI